MSKVSAVELQQILNTFPNKTSSSFNGLSMKILKLIIPHIATILLAIINKSFMSGTFPNILKVARVVLVFKGGTHDKLVNYRPISILPTLQKIFKRLMYNRLLSCINKYNILFDCQFGFRKNRNTEQVVLNTLNNIVMSVNYKISTL